MTDVRITLTEIADGVSLETTPQSITVFDGVFSGGGSGTVTSVNTVEPVDGDVTLAPSDIGAATSAQGALADTATQPSDLGTSAPLDVASSGNASSGQVVKGNDSRLTDSRTPSTHTHAESDVTGLVSDLAAKVPATRTVAGHALSGDVTITASDVGAAATSHTHAESDVTGLTSDLAGKVPTTRTVAGHALSANVAIDYADLTGTPPAGLPWFDVTTYGATGDGTTDDTTTINLAIAALNTAGKGVLYFPAGTYKTTAALTTVNVPCTIMGDGCADALFRAAPTTINFTSATGVLFTLGTSAHGTRMEGLNLVNTAGSTPTAGAAIQVLGGDGNRYIDLSIKRFWIDMDVQDGGEWYMDRCFLFNPIKYGLKIQHIDLPDGGDMGVLNCQFIADSNADAAIRWETGGGLRLIGSKINFRSSGKFGVGLDVDMNVTTVDLNVAACSFENTTGPAIKGRVGVLGEFSAATIVGNQFGYYTSTSAAAVDIDEWLDVTVVGNTFLARFSGSSAAAVKLNAVDGGSVGLNSVEGFAGGELSQTSCSGIVTVPDTSALVPNTRTVNSKALSSNITLSNTDVGAAATSHTHGAADVNSGTLGTARLGSGTADNTKFLRGDQTWAAPSSGFADPTTTKGDLIAHGSTTTRLGVGSDNQVLTADSAQTLGVKWATPASGFADPTTTKGDLIVHGASTTRQAVGSDGQVLTADSAQTSGVKWATPSAGGALGATRVYKTSSQSLTSGTRAAIIFDNEAFDDLSAHDNSTNPTRLTIGTTGRYRVVANAGIGTAAILLEIRKNSTLPGTLGTRIGLYLNPASGENVGIVDSGIIALSSGDWIEIGIMSIGANTTVDSPAADTCWASLERIT